MEKNRLLYVIFDFAAPKFGSVEYFSYICPQIHQGRDMQKLNENKQKFLQKIEPKWIEEAKKNGKLIEI